MASPSPSQLLCRDLFGEKAGRHHTHPPVNHEHHQRIVAHTAAVVTHGGLRQSGPCPDRNSDQNLLNLTALASFENAVIFWEGQTNVVHQGVNEATRAAGRGLTHALETVVEGVQLMDLDQTQQLSKLAGGEDPRVHGLKALP